MIKGTIDPSNQGIVDAAHRVPLRADDDIGIKGLENLNETLNMAGVKVATSIDKGDDIAFGSTDAKF